MSRRVGSGGAVGLVGWCVCLQSKDAVVTLCVCWSISQSLIHSGSQAVRQSVCLWSVCLSVDLSVCLSVCLACLSVRLSCYLSVICLAVGLSVCLSVRLPVRSLSVCLSVCLKVCLKVCLSVCLSVCCLSFGTVCPTCAVDSAGGASMSW